MTNAQHSSESNEHYTPTVVVEASRNTMGRIDLDPASCALANAIIRAGSFFTILDGGHAMEWMGAVFLNPPGGRIDDQWRPVKVKCGETGACGIEPGHKHTGTGSSIVRWWDKLVTEWDAGRVEQAIFVAFTLELLQTAQRSKRSPLSLPFCIPSSRLQFLHPNADGSGVEEGGSPTHANAVIYLPPKIGSLAAAHRFRRCFEPIGSVVIPTITIHGEGS